MNDWMHERGAPQLAGEKCNLCDRTIGSVLDGRFCDECGSPIHNKCAHPGVNKEDCRLCGTAGAILDAREEERVKEIAASVKNARSQQAMVHVGLGIMWIVGGALASMFCFGLASGVGAGSFFVFTGAIVAGIAQIAHGIRLSRRSN